jgi:23S rRNA pseudouridine2604 synthase
MNEKDHIRINKYLSEIGFCSRRKADRLIIEGKVLINDKKAELGSKVSREDKIKVEEKIITSKTKKKRIYLAFNKPKGIVCTTDVKREKHNIIDYIKYPSRVFPIGRLDKYSQGLIFLTNDGDIVNKILRSRNNHEKEYEVLVDKPVTKEFVEKMQNGVPILSTITKKCKIKQTGKKTFNIILTQGLNRQIRRMCEYCGYKVKKLKRIRIMNIKLDVKEGEHRDFTLKELNTLRQLTQNSTKNFE